MKKAGLTREKILKAAVVLVDRSGVGALSMRRLGVELGVEAMSLYRYVSNKSDLLDGVFETILRELKMPPDSGDWAKDAKATAQAFRTVLQAHPNAAPLFAGRPAVTPGSLDYVEETLERLERAGFSPERALTALQTVMAFIVGFAMDEFADLDPAIPQVNYQALPSDRYPCLSALPSVLAGYDAEVEFELGLDVVIAGLTVLRKQE